MFKRNLIFIGLVVCLGAQAQLIDTLPVRQYRSDLWEPSKGGPTFMRLDSWYLKGQLHYGFILQHRNTMGHLVHGHIGGFELNYSRPTYGEKLWHHENNFPERGFQFTYTYLANPEQLGSVYAIAPFYDVPLNKKIKPSRLYLRLSTGLAYASKKFDPVENHKNNVISARFNAYINFKWYYKFNLGDRLRLETGLSFSHASNGKYKAPNLGVNMVTAFAGLTYRFKTDKRPNLDFVDSSTMAKSRHELYAIAAFGINETEPPGGPKFLAQSYLIGYYFNKRNTHKFGAGFDLFYDQSVIQDIYDADSVRYDRKSQYIQAGVRLSYAYNIGRVSFPVEFGRYLYTRFTGDGMFYHRIGMRYYTKNNIIYTFSLKTHWAVAHYFEFGLGYRLPLKKKRPA